MQVLTAIIHADAIESELKEDNISKKRAKNLKKILDNINKLRKQGTYIELSIMNEYDWEKLYNLKNEKNQDITFNICGAYLGRCIKTAEQILNELKIPYNKIKSACAKAKRQNIGFIKKNLKN